MVFTKGTKEQFIDMFGKHEIVVVSHKYGNKPTSYEHKFIGQRDGIRLDFTPLVIHCSGCKSNRSGLAARGLSHYILSDAIISLRAEGFDIPSNYVMSISDFIQTFYFE